MKTKLPNNYFPHDFNSRYDRKIQRLRKVLGLEGYGMFWMLIETLCTEEDFSYPLKDLDLLANEFGCSVEKIEAVVKQFDLFQIDDEAKFFSLSLITRLQKYLETSEKARQNVNKRWEKAKKLKQMSTVVLPLYNHGDTIKGEEIKGEEKTEENPETLWRIIFLNNPGIVEIDFVNKLIEKFRYKKAKTILYNFKKQNFHSIQTMENSLNEDGSIKPRLKGTDDGKTIDYRPA